MKTPITNKINIPLSGTAEYPTGTPIAPIAPVTGSFFGMQGTMVYPGGSVAFLKIKKFFDPLVNMAKEYLDKHNKPDDVVRPMQPSELKGEAIAVRSDNR